MPSLWRSVLPLVLGGHKQSFTGTSCADQSHHDWEAIAVSESEAALELPGRDGDEPCPPAEQHSTE